MRRISMNIGTHGVETTASEMRKRIAKVVSKIPGDQIVFFNLTLHLENYMPTPSGPSITKIPDSPTTRHARLVFGELARPEND